MPDHAEELAQMEEAIEVWAPNQLPARQQTPRPAGQDGAGQQ